MRNAGKRCPFALWTSCFDVVKMQLNTGGTDLYFDFVLCRRGVFDMRYALNISI